MTQSSLCTYRNITGNHSAGRGGNKVCKITPHYMAARWSGKQCADYFASTSRQASSNYCIGIDGDIAMSVDEDDRAWTSSSGWNDRQAITIECGDIDNSTGEMTQATWDSLVSLCADICRRYGFRLIYTGDRNGSLTEHRMFASTDCPGQWLHARMGQLAREVNARLDGGASATATSDEEDDNDMNCIIQPDGTSVLVYFDGHDFHDLSHPDDVTALDMVYQQCHPGRHIPMFKLGTTAAPWFARLAQAVHAGEPSSALVPTIDGFKPRSPKEA